MESGQNPEIENVTPGSELTSAQYIELELKRSKTSLKATQWGGGVFVLGVMFYLGGITNGFAAAMEPKEAANIAKGMIDERVNDNLPSFKQYIKEKVPTLIADVPNYAKRELPNYRQNLENQLAHSIDEFSTQTSSLFADRVDTFLSGNQGAVGELISNTQDPKALSTMDANMQQMFVDYLGNTQLNEETLKSKIDKTLEGLNDIDDKIRHLALNKHLTDQEKKTRKAIAILMATVNQEKAINDAQTVVASLKGSDVRVIPAAMEGQLTWTDNGDEAVFTAAGHPPMHFVRKSDGKTFVKVAAKVERPAIKHHHHDSEDEDAPVRHHSHHHSDDEDSNESHHSHSHQSENHSSNNNKSKNNDLEHAKPHNATAASTEGSAKTY